MAIKKVVHTGSGTSVNSPKELQDKVLEPTTKALISKMSDEIYRHMYDLTQERVYDAYTPTNYERTGEFLESLTKEKGDIYGGNIFQAKVYFDASKIKPVRSPVSGQWNQHMGLQGQKFTGGLVDVIEEGQQTKSAWDRKGTHIIADTLEWFENEAYEIGADLSSVDHYVYQDDAPMDKAPKGVNVRKRV